MRLQYIIKTNTVCGSFLTRPKISRRGSSEPRSNHHPELDPEDWKANPPTVAQSPRKMACSRCSAHARLLRAAARPAPLAQPARFALIAARFQASTQTRVQSSKAGPEEKYPDIDEVVKNAPKAPAGTGMMGTYAIYQGTEQICKRVRLSRPRTRYPLWIGTMGLLSQLPDGEELGVSEGPWHKRMVSPLSSISYISHTLFWDHPRRRKIHG